MRNVFFEGTFRHSSLYAGDVKSYDFIVTFKREVTATGAPADNFV